MEIIHRIEYSLKMGISRTKVNPLTRSRCYPDSRNWGSCLSNSKHLRTNTSFSATKVTYTNYNEYPYTILEK